VAENDVQMFNTETKYPVKAGIGWLREEQLFNIDSVS